MPPSRGNSKTIDACIVSYSTKDLTVRTVGSLLKSSKEMLPINIVVWDNASEDDSRVSLAELTRTEPVTVICSHENLGYGRALNRAFAMGNAPYLLVLNSDLEFPEPDWLVKLVTYMEAYPDVGVVAPLLLDEQGRIGGAGVIGSTTNREIRWWREPFELCKKQLMEEGTKECISVCGACMLMRRKAFEDCQGFDEGFPFYFEETSLHRLMRVFSWKVMFYPYCTVTHLWNKSPKKGRSREWFEQGEAHFNHIWGDGVRIEADDR